MRNVASKCLHLYREYGLATDASSAGRTLQGVLHQALSAQRSEQFGQDYGVWLKQWRLLQRSVFVIDRNDRIVYVEYVADQLREPDYTAALQAVQQAAVQS